MHDQRREVEHPGPWQHAADGREDRLGRLDDERGEPAAARRVDPRQQHAREDQQLQREDEEPEEVEEEGARHGSSLPVGRAPKIALPMRTSVAPSSTATA